MTNVRDNLKMPLYMNQALIDKRTDLASVVAQIRDGDTVGFGGSELERKPFAAVRGIVRSSLRNLTVISRGGMEVDLLIGAGKATKVIYPSVSMGGLGVPPNFVRARRTGSVQLREISETMFVLGWRAAAEGMPFFPTRTALGTDIITVNPEIRTITCPYTGDTLVAMPAFEADFAFICVNMADPSGYGLIFGDPMGDHWMAQGAKRTFLVAEKVVSPSELKGHAAAGRILRFWVEGVIELAWGAHPGECFPHYQADTGHLREYAAAASSEETFSAYVEKYVSSTPDHSSYLERVGGVAKLERLKKND